MWSACWRRETLVRFRGRRGRRTGRISKERTMRTTMTRRAFLGFFAVTTAAMLSHGVANATPRSNPPTTETAVFAGGCFWGIQSVFQHVKGVVTATSGYAGGSTDKPSYEDVSTGRTGHAES